MATTPKKPAVSKRPKMPRQTAAEAKRTAAIKALAGTPLGGLMAAFAHIPMGKIKVWPLSK
jgi:hypothetical protein